MNPDGVEEWMALAEANANPRLSRKRTDFPTSLGERSRRSRPPLGGRIAVKRAKVQKITPHDLRHTCASLAVSAGVNVLALQRMLGHTSAKVTLDTYADLFDDDLDAVAVTLHSRYSRESVAKRCSRQLVANTEIVLHLRFLAGRYGGGGGV